MTGKNYITRYGLGWPRTIDPAALHRDCIRMGGTWTDKHGNQVGGGLEHHYHELIKILWPDTVFHRWFNLILEKYLKHRSIAIIGPASSGKTFSASIIVLTDYLCFPDETTVIVCSTTKERLEDRVWGEIKSHFRRAKAERSWLSGNIIEGRMRIITDSRQDSPDGRDFRNGLCGVALKRGESWIGIAEFSGIKNKRVRLLGDEISLAPKVFVDSISNLDKNEDFKLVGLGNPKDTMDALGIMAEPARHLGGWESGIDQAAGTKCWETRRQGGIAIQLPGTDSPNLDGKLGIPIISQADIDRDVSFYGRDSLWFTMMDLGVMPRGAGARRVLTRQLCEKFGAMEPPVWRDSNIKRIAFMDAAWGGDRCMFGELAFGYEAANSKPFLVDSALAASAEAPGLPKQIVAVVDLMVVPVHAELSQQLIEDQIVEFVMKQCEKRGIPPSNFYFDAGMRTSLVMAFARVWSRDVESVDCGGKPGEEMVSADIQKPCNDYYSKKITRLWYSVRLTVEAGQFRGMPEQALQDFCDREWTLVAGNKIEVEPKDKMKAKISRSPDAGDAVAIGLFGACNRGFVIAKLVSPKVSKEPDWKAELRKKSQEIWATGQLEFASS